MALSDEHKRDLAKIVHACNVLGEDFDSVRIFATRHEGGIGTVPFSWGVGNWFAQTGQIQDWLKKGDEQVRVEVRAANYGNS